MFYFLAGRMTLKRFDDLILQVFESSEKFFFPISTQRQAKAFVKDLHSKGLEYNNISDEINESDERFSTWRKGLSCNKVGRIIIQRINQPLLQFLQEVHSDGDDDDDGKFEVFLGVEPNLFSVEKPDARKKSKLWKPKANSGSLEKTSETSSEDSIKHDISPVNQNCCLKSIAVNSIPTSQKVSQEHLGMSYGDLISFEEPCETRAENASPKTMNRCSRTNDDHSYTHPDVVKNEDSVLRSPSDASTTEDQFYDCDSFKSYSSTFMDDSVLSNPQYHSCVQELSPLGSSVDQTSDFSPEKARETKSPFEMESYNSDLDISCYDDVPPHVREINRLLIALPRNRSQPGCLYVFRENSSDLMFKIGASRNPDKKLLQASIFNNKLTLFRKFKVTNMDEALARTYLRLDAWKVDGHLGWFRGDDKLLQELENVEI